MMTRRELLETCLLSSAALALPWYRTAEAASRDLPDLAVGRIEWSDDFGGHWSNDPVADGSDVWFRVIVENRGSVAWPPNIPFSVEVIADDSVIAWSAGVVSGLAKDASTEVRSAETIDGEKVWVAKFTPGGEYALQARINLPDRQPEDDLTNNESAVTVLAVEATASSDGTVSNLGVAGQIAGTVVGGIVGGPVGGAIGGLIGAWSGSLASGSISSSTPIGYNSQVGNGGYFPHTVTDTAGAFGTSSSQLLDAIKKFGFIPSWNGNWKNSGGVKVFGSDGLLEYIHYSKAAAKGYLIGYRSKMNLQDEHNLALWVDGFVSNTGPAVASGSVPTTDGCGITNFYASCAGTAAFGNPISSGDARFASLKQVCVQGGFYNCNIAVWGVGLGHASSLSNSLKPSQTNGDTIYNGNGLRRATEGVYQAIAVFGGTAGDWAKFGAGRSKAQNIVLPGIAWVIQMILVRFLVRGLARKAVVDDVMAWLTANWRALASRAWIEALFDTIMDGSLVSSPLRNSIGSKLMNQMKSKGVTIDSAVYTELAKSDNLNVYRDAIDIYSDFIGGVKFTRVRVVSGPHLNGVV